MALLIGAERTRSLAKIHRSLFLKAERLHIVYRPHDVIFSALFAPLSEHQLADDSSSLWFRRNILDLAE